MTRAPSDLKTVSALGADLDVIFGAHRSEGERHSLSDA
jgi:hypothetical protein